MKIEYDKVGDYYVPRIALRKRKYEERILSRYGRAYLRYLKENKKGLCTELLLDDRLFDEVYEQDLRAQNMEKSNIEFMKKKENITEELKEKDQMKWVGLMNNIKHSAVEIVMKELLK